MKQHRLPLAVLSAAALGSLAFGLVPQAQAAAPCAPPATVADPSATGSFAVGRSDYQLPTRVRVGSDSVRLWATVRYPAAQTGTDTPVASGAGLFPILFFLHGNHGKYRVTRGTSIKDYCETPSGTYTETPNHEGYNFILENAARAGYIAVSLNANDLNCKNDRIHERALLIEEHILLWKRNVDGSDTSLGSQFRGRV